jgi:hypothetical protein
MKLERWLQYSKVRGACKPGLDEAKALLCPVSNHSIEDVLTSELSHNYKTWILMEHAKTDERSMRLLRNWVKACCNEAGIAHPAVSTPNGCQKSMREAIRLKSKQGGLQAARAWSCAQLIAAAARNRK